MGYTGGNIMSQERYTLWKNNFIAYSKAIAIALVVITVLIGTYYLGYLTAVHDTFVDAVQNNHGHWSVIDKHGNTEFVWN